MANEPKRRIASQTKQTLEKVYFYIREEQRKEEIVKKQTNKQKANKQETSNRDNYVYSVLLLFLNTYVKQNNVTII